jgi:hypothetical protein
VYMNSGDSDGIGHIDAMEPSLNPNFHAITNRNS